MASEAQLQRVLEQEVQVRTDGLDFLRLLEGRSHLAPADVMNPQGHRCCRLQVKTDERVVPRRVGHARMNNKPYCRGHRKIHPDKAENLALSSETSRFRN